MALWRCEECGDAEIRRQRPNSPRRPRPNSPFPQKPQWGRGFRRMMGHHGGIMAHRHLPTKPSLRTLIADGNPVWALRHVREAVEPAMVCVKKADVDPSVSAIRREEGPINRRGVARAAPGPWHREIMANPPNRHCARRPSSRPLLAEEGPRISGAFTAPPRGTLCDEHRGKSEELLSAVRTRKEAFPARRRMAAISPSTPLEADTDESTASEIGRPFPRLWT